MAEYKLIGGPRDGEYVELDKPLMILSVNYQTLPETLRRPSTDPIKSEEKITQYMLETLFLGDMEWNCYRHVDLPIEAFLKRFR